MLLKGVLNEDLENTYTEKNMARNSVDTIIYNANTIYIRMSTYIKKLKNGALKKRLKIHIIYFLIF